MFPSAPGPTTNLSLEQVIGWMKQHGAVEGIALLGSTCTLQFTPSSDCDLFIVLSSRPVHPMALCRDLIG